jgi:hypothetical protein
VHEYSVDAFGLSSEAVGAAFAFYLDRFAAEV